MEEDGKVEEGVLSGFGALAMGEGEVSSFVQRSSDITIKYRN